MHQFFHNFDSVFTRQEKQTRRTGRPPVRRVTFGNLERTFRREVKELFRVVRAQTEIPAQRVGAALRSPMNCSDFQVWAGNAAWVTQERNRTAEPASNYSQIRRLLEPHRRRTYSERGPGKRGRLALTGPSAPGSPAAFGYFSPVKSTPSETVPLIRLAFGQPPSPGGGKP